MHITVPGVDPGVGALDPPLSIPVRWAQQIRSIGLCSSSSHGQSVGDGHPTIYKYKYIGLRTVIFLALIRQARIQDSEGGSYIQKGGEVRTGISGADPNCCRVLGKSTSKKKLQTAVGGGSDPPPPVSAHVRCPYNSIYTEKRLGICLVLIFMKDKTRDLLNV